jgi:hypothetical protein
MTEWMPLVVAALAGAVAFSGQIYNQAKQRRIDTGKTFAEAMSAVSDYEDLAFRVRRRPSSTPETRWELSQRISEVHTRMDYYTALLDINAPEVAVEYRELVEKVREVFNVYIKDAWTHPPYETDTDMNQRLGQQYPGKETVDPARITCTEAMRRRLVLKFPSRKR